MPLPSERYSGETLREYRLFSTWQMIMAAICLPIPIVAAVSPFIIAMTIDSILVAVLWIAIAIYFKHRRRFKKLVRENQGIVVTKKA